MDERMRIRARMIEDDRELDLVIADGTIAENPPAADAEPDLVGWVLPGLVDMHNHLSLASPAGDGQPAAVRVRASASVELALGVLAIREPGSPDDASMHLVAEEGWPRITTAGRFLAPPGRYFPGLAREVTADELASAAEQEARRSGGWAKIIGDYLVDGRFVANWPAPVLREAVGRVHAQRGRVAVHAVGPDAVADAIAARVDSIEHGQGVTESHFAEMRDHGIAWVPTLGDPGHADAAFEFATALGATASTATWLRDATRQQPSVAGRAHHSGVVVLAGTDGGQFPHGMLVEQIQLLMDGGMPAAAAIGAASWTARRYLGLPGLDLGAPADLVVYGADPRKDLDVLRRPAMIMLAGQPIRPYTGEVPH